MKKVLIISGSPRKGNTDFALDSVFDGVKYEKEIIFLRDKKIGHCIGCLSCHEKPECVIEDDMTEIREKMVEADVLIIGTPNYFDNVSGLLKNFADRTHPLYKAELLKDKKLILVMVGGGKADISREYLNHTMHGFVKYLKLNLIGSYCFQALHQNDLKENSEAVLEIEKIIEKINSL